MAEPERSEAKIQQEPGDAPAEDRRGALRTLVSLGGLAYAAAIAVPAAAMLAPPSGGERGERWVRVARLTDLPPSGPRRFAVQADERDAFTVTPDQVLGSVWLTREGDGVHALSATCPHLGCSIDVAPDERSFSCPCHASRFTLAGTTESGPSPRPLDAFAARIVDGWVEVDFRRYRQGIAERREQGA